MAVSEEVEEKLQELYVKLLRSHPITSLLDSPTKVFEKLVAQQIQTVLQDVDKLREEIRSSPLFLQQARTLLTKVLLKTSYKELRRVEAALKNGIQRPPGEGDCIPEEIAERIFVAFTGIAMELELEAGGAIVYSPVIPINRRQENEGDRSDSRVSEYNPTSSNVTALNQQLFFTIAELQEKAKLEEFLTRPGIKEKQVWMYDGSTILHDAAQSSNWKWAVELITTVMKFIEENEDFPWTAQEFLDQQTKDDDDDRGIYSGAIPVVKCLIDHGANILIRDKERITPLELMYDLMPEALMHILSSSGVISYGNLKHTNASIRLDFGSFVDALRVHDDDDTEDTPAKDRKKANGKDKGRDIGSPNGDINDVVMEMTPLKTEDTSTAGKAEEEGEQSLELEPEMDRLAFTIYRQFDTTAPHILSHIVVKIFLELKWKKLKWPIYFLTLFYIAFYMSFTAIASYVFMMEFPYSASLSDSTQSDAHLSKATQAEPPEFGIHLAISIPFAVAMTLYVGMEIWQYYLILTLSAKSGWEALLFYLRDLENVLQALYLVGSLLVMGALCTGGRSTAPVWSYWMAAFSVVVTWILILLQLGNFHGLGKYVHMFQTVFTRFATVMALYLCFLIGFNIACGIVFPQEKVFSYPRSFFRSVAMLTGESNFDEVFNPEEPRPFELAALITYSGSIIIVTIVVGNLLVGLTVDDVAKIFKDADAIHRRIQVERLYILEHLLCRLRINWDMFVVPKERRIYGAVVCMETGKLSKPLQRELRCLLANPELYKRRYLQLD